jgi:DHA3 family macrolide efflux protein-like MFS transporter
MSAANPAVSGEDNPLLQARPADTLPLPAPPEPMSMAAVLKIPTMRRLWYAQVVSVFGDFLALFAVMIIVTFNLHATARQVTWLQIAYLGPIAVLGIVSGVFADRWPIKKTLVASDFTRAVLCLLLFKVHSLLGFYLVMGSISVVSSVFSPAQGIALRTVVPMHGLRSANALMQQVMFVMRVIGGPITSWIASSLGSKGPKICFGLDVASFVASGCLLASLAITIIPKPKAALDATGGPSGVGRVLHDMREGASFIFHHAGLLFVITAMAAGMFALGCFAPMIAVYVRDNLHASTKTFGTTSMMIGIGMLTGMNLLTTAAKKTKHSTLVYFGLGGMGLGCVLIAALVHLWATIPALLIVGFSAAAIIVPSQTMIQTETPQAMLGRVGSTVMSLIFGAQIIGLFLSGVLANLSSVRGVFALTAVLLAVLVVVGKLWMEPKSEGQ